MARSMVGKRTRQVLVFVHVVVSLGWMGAGAANVVLAMTAGYTGSADVRRVCYLMIDRIDQFLVIPGAFAALASGVLLSVVTPWGLARYWWVLVKLVLTVAVILYSTFGLGVWVIESIEATAAGAPESTVAGPLAYGATLNLVAFLFMTWASIAKPWGTTPWTRRTPAARRTRAAPSTSPA
ncbi:hypothetical protein ACQEVB_29475 [Pseudonocardia sp. CA-107938]|uniref:hypothetical protein n=1 Tax=Pseudonocardia sp. CA-107938 TaxID=3240021 RepID=UPI003D8BA721